MHEGTFRAPRQLLRPSGADYEIYPHPSVAAETDPQLGAFLSQPQITRNRHGCQW